MNTLREKSMRGNTASFEPGLLQLVPDRLGSAVFLFDQEGKAVYANDAASRLLESALEELLTSQIHDWAPHFTDDLWRELWQKSGSSANSTMETYFRSKSGRLFLAEMTSSHISCGHGEFICCVAKDISAYRQEEESIKMAKAIFMSSNEAIIVTGKDNNIVQINPACTRITGYPLDELHGKNPAILWSDLYDGSFHLDMQTSLDDTGSWQGEMWNRRRSGDLFAAQTTISSIRDEDGNLSGHIVQFVEITEKKKKEEQTWWHANYDTLTALPNRRLFHDRLAQEINKSEQTGQRLALMFIDLNQFKQINDNLGHDKGDLLLAEAALRIVKSVRKTDSVARLGGDEFTVILPDFGDKANIERIALSIISKLEEPFQMKDATGSVSASIGVAVYPDDATDAEELVNCADRAMYETKKKGQGQMASSSTPRLYRNSLNSYAQRRHLYFKQSE